MTTKKQYWDQIVDGLSFKQYRKITELNGINRTYDGFFKLLPRVTKSKKLLELSAHGLTAPLQNRYSLMDVSSNSFGDQIIRIYDLEKHESLTLVNQEGSHEDPSVAVEYLNRNSRRA